MLMFTLVMVIIMVIMMMFTMMIMMLFTMMMVMMRMVMKLVPTTNEPKGFCSSPHLRRDDDYNDYDGDDDFEHHH